MKSHSMVVVVEKDGAQKRSIPDTLILRYHDARYHHIKRESVAMFDYDQLNYTIAESTRIAGQVAITGRSWFAKKWLQSKTDPMKPASQGGTSYVTGRTVLAHAIAAKGAGVLGIPPLLACRAARGFTDVSSDPQLDPGQLYGGGDFTYLGIYPDGNSSLLRVTKGKLDDMLFGMMERDGCWLLPLDFIVKHVEIELRAIDERGQN